MKFEHYTNNWLYQMQQTTAYCMEKGEQFLNSINAGLTLDQFITLDILSLNSGFCQMDLAKAILKDRVYTSRMLNTLEEKDLVERKIETKGKRLVKKVYLTREGERIHSELVQELEEVYIAVFKDIPDDEEEIIKNGIMKIKDCVSKYTVMPL
jgi:DNA-binding MarR family transcriptional regulator